MAPKLPPLRELHFGELDASQEAARSPELLRYGYFDFREAAYSIAARRAWVLLGPKGSGKSAVLEYLRLQWADRPDRFMTYWELDTFPIQDVTRVDMGQGAGGQRAQSAWELLLFLRIYESLDRDGGRSSSGDFESTLAELKRQGLIHADLKSLVLGLSKTGAGVNFKVATAQAEWSTSRSALTEVAHQLRTALTSVQLDSQHLVALDGLDTFFFEGGAGWESLAGLIDALASVNRFMLEIDTPISVVATLRSDHFDALNSQNSNKLKDQTVYLDWTTGGIGAANKLWMIPSRKAAVSRPQITDIVRQYLSEPMERPAFPSVAEYLLSYTRLLPRDVTAVMQYVQTAHPGSTPVTEAHAKEATLRYSEEYFVGEMMNNISGVLPSADAHNIVPFRDALRSAPTRYFNMQYLREELEGVLDPSHIRALLHRMFETGCIGISNPTVSGERYTDFTFRRVSGAAFTPRYDFLLHDALTRAWNRPWR